MRDLKSRELLQSLEQAAGQRSQSIDVQRAVDETKMSAGEHTQIRAWRCAGRPQEAAW